MHCNTLSSLNLVEQNNETEQCFKIDAALHNGHQDQIGQKANVKRIKRRHPMFIYL